MRPRVVSVCLDLSPSHGGMYRAVTDLARMLGSPLVSFRDGSGREPPTVTDVPVTTIDWSSYSLLRQAIWPPGGVRRAAEVAIGEADCLVVHSLFRSHAQIVHRLAAVRRIPYVVVPHGALEPALWRSKRLLRRGWMLAGGGAYLRDAAAIVFATADERAHAEETLGRPLAAHVIPFAVPAGGAGATAAEKAAARQALGLPASRRLLLALGRLDPVKRPREFVSWFCRAEPAGCDLVIAGMDGTITANELRGEVPAAFRDRVWFLGGLDAGGRDAALAACDGYLSWSRHESFGYAAAESLAAGLPVILPPGHGLRAEIEPEGCGFFPPADDRESFAAAIREFARSPLGELRARGEAGRVWVKKHLRADSVTVMWQDILSTITNRDKATHDPKMPA
jgi:glycosyltransferase involved in cell wall biosynthesis